MTGPRSLRCQLIFACKGKPETLQNRMRFLGGEIGCYPARLWGPVGAPHVKHTPLHALPMEARGQSEVDITQEASPESRCVNGIKFALVIGCSDSC